jgi:hypothetical protein
MMLDTIAQMSEFNEKAQWLEHRVSQRATLQQLREIAQEAASYRRVLAVELISDIGPDRKQLSALSEKFSFIEIEASLLHYRGNIQR